MLDDPARARFAALDTLAQFLAAPGIDLVFHGLTVTLTRDTGAAISFGPVTFHDGQAVLTRGGRLPAGASVCVAIAGRFADNLASFMRAKDMDLAIVAAADFPAARAAFAANQCDALTADASTLFAAADGQSALLPERLSREPLAPVVRKEDGDLLAVLRWTIFALIQAEEDGVTADNIASRLHASPASMRAYTDAPGAAASGLAPEWPAAVIRRVGNYGEIYRRHFLRPGGPMLPRGANALWLQGGLLYAPPFR